MSEKMPLLVIAGASLIALASQLEIPKGATIDIQRPPISPIDREPIPTIFVEPKKRGSRSNNVVRAKDAKNLRR